MIRILFMGSDEVACPALDRLLASDDVHVVSVVTQPDRPKGRHQQISACPAKQHAEAHGVPVLTPERIGAPDAVHELAALRPDLIVVAAYGQYIKPAILELPPLGAINIHPSLLPKYRGASPIQWAIANGDVETGVTILHVAKEMDAGDIILQERMPIGPDDTAATMIPRLSELGATLLMRAIADLQAGRAARIPQDPAGVTEVYKLDKEDGWIDWTLPAEAIRNRIRGFQPWPVCYTLSGGKRIKVWRAAVEETSSVAGPGIVIDCGKEGPLIATGEGALRLLAVQPEGKKTMDGGAYLCGNAMKVGEQLESRPL